MNDPASIAEHAPPGTPAQGHPMDLAFIRHNQIVERYLGGRLPVRGAQDFERFCRDNPSLVAELGLAEHVNAGFRLLEAAGEDLPWTPGPQPWWQQPRLLIGAAAVTALLLIATCVLWYVVGQRNHRITLLQAQLATQPLQAVATTRTLTLTPSRAGTPVVHAATLGGGRSELADLRIDMSWSRLAAYRITIDQVDHGRVMVLDRLQRDSNGHLRLALNSTALRPGRYAAQVDGLDRRGAATSLAAFAFTVAPPPQP